MSNEPKIHSHVEDCLLEDHPLAYEMIFCLFCNKMIHASNNECMSTWVEEIDKNLCIECFCRKELNYPLKLFSK